MKKVFRSAGDSIQSMVSALTMPALLQGSGHRVRQRTSVLQFAIVLIAGCAHAASLAWPFGSVFTPGQPLWWLQLMAIGLLAGQLDAQVVFRTWQRGAALGLLFATAMLCGTFWWLYTSMHNYGGLSAPLAVLAVLLLASLLGLYYAVASIVFVRLAPPARWQRALLFAALWLMAELARVQLFTGFPWGEGGYAHVDGWARPLAAWVGVHGVTFLAAFVAAWLVMLMRVSHVRWAMVASLLMGAVALSWVPVQSGVAALQAKAPLPGTQAVTLLQGNIAQNEKFEPGTGVVTSLAWYRERLLAATTPMVIAPETAIPVLPQQLPEGYWAPLQQHFSRGPQAALIGIPLGDLNAGYSNSVVGLKPLAAGTSAAGVEPYRYDKHHLVPFGEFIPPGFRWFTNLMKIPLGDFNRGAVGQPSFDWLGQRLAPNICYEDLFGEELGARFIDPARAPTVFVNVSNIAWFGNSIAIDQHLQISRMRALEFSRPMLRATNTGATVIIDHRGQVTHALERHTRGALVGDFEGQNVITPYAWWVSRYGLMPFWVLGIAMVLMALVRRR
jgi:apolipoprotein N-acyltransferase